MDFMVWLVHEATPEQLAWLKSIGVTKVLLALPNFQVPEIITRCHDAGLKVIARWPEWKTLGHNEERYAFRNYLGETCPTDDADTAGPSYWCPVAHKDATKSIRKYLDLSVDGLLIAPRYSDIPFPRYWDAADNDEYRYNTQFWCHDEWAIADWQANGNPGNPPTHAVLDADGSVVPDPGFYRWYQGGWRNRLTVLTKCALTHGFKDLYTWHLPLASATLENVALGTYDSDYVYQEWVDQCVLGSASPTLVSACLFGSFHSQRSTTIAHLEQASRKWGCNVMVGAEVCHNTESVLPNLVVNGIFAKARGWSLFGSGRYLFDPNNRNPITSLLQTLLLEERTTDEDPIGQAPVCESTPELGVPDLPLGVDVCSQPPPESGP